MTEQVDVLAAWSLYRWLSFAVMLVTAATARADVDYKSLDKYWTADALHVPYRLLVTPGREDAELLPLIVFLHGAWQDGDNNESQLAGYGNGSLELVDTALDGDIPTACRNQPIQHLQQLRRHGREGANLFVATLNQASDNGLGMNVEATASLMNDLHKKLLPVVA